MDLTAQQLLAQGGQTNPQAPPTDVPNQTDPLSGASQTAFPALGQDPAATLLSGLPPAPPKGGISESPADQFRRLVAQNSDTLIKQASDPSAPGAWARAIMGGVQSALAGVGNIGTVPKGGGALYGVGKVMQAQQQEQHQKQEDAAKAKQQQFENDYKQRELKDREDAQNAAGLLNQIAIQKALRESTTAAQDDMHNRIYAPWKKAEEDSGAQVIQEGMSSSELQDLAKKHATKEDPNGTSWLASQIPHQDGWRDVTDANGNTVPQVDPRTGKPTGMPQRQATYSLMTYGDPITITPEIAAQAKKYNLGNLTEGTVLKPQDAALLKSQIGKAVVDEHAADALALATGTTESQLADLRKKDAFRKAGPAFLPWLTDAKGDANLALENMRLHSLETDANGQPTPEAQKAKEQYDTVTAGMGDEIIKDSMKNFGEEEKERVKANLDAAKAGAKDKAMGDTTMNGPNYLASIPDPAERAMIQELGTGRMAVGRMEYLIARNPRVAEELSLAFPELRTGKISAYVDAAKKFASGVIANQINSAGTNTSHMEALMQSNLVPGAFTGGKAYQDRQGNLNDASKELARFLSGGNAPTKEDIEGARKSLDPSWFNTAIAGDTLPEVANEAVANQAKRVYEKIQQYKDEWNDALPSPTWTQKLPGWSDRNDQTYNRIINGGKEPPAPVPQGATHTVMGSDGQLHWTNDAGTQDFGVKK